MHSRLYLHSSGVDFASVIHLDDGSWLLVGEEGSHRFPEPADGCGERLVSDSSNTTLHKVATFLISVRYAVIGLFVLITLFMLYSMLQLRIETGFKKQLPLQHEYMQTFLEYEKEFGGANRILVALVARDGDMFTPELFRGF